MSYPQGFSDLGTTYQAFQDLHSDQYSNSYGPALEHIKKALEPNTAVAGFQTPTAQGTGGALWPLIPEDLDNTISQVDFQANDLAFWDWLPKGVAKQTVVQYMRWVSHGLIHMDNAVFEGEIAAQNIGAYGRGTAQRPSVQIKQYTETRAITDLMAAISIAGQPAVPSDALAFQTQEGMLALHRCLEVDALFGDSTIAAAKMDGVIPLLKAAGDNSNALVQNLDGAQLSLELLEDITRDLQSAPYYGQPTHVFVTPKVFTSLSRQQVAMARRNMDGKGIVFGFDDKGMTVQAGLSKLTVTPLKFLDIRKQIPVTAEAVKKGTSVTTGNVPIQKNGAPLAIDNAQTGTSLFGATDAGWYAYAVMEFGPDGYTKWLPLKTADVGGQPNWALQVAAGDKVKATLDGFTTVTYAKVFRTKRYATEAELEAAIGSVNNAAPTKPGAYQYLFSVAQPVANGAAQDLVIKDLNEERTDCGHTLILRQDAAEIELYQLIKLMRYPLARVSSVQPFMLINAQGLALKVPEHAALIRNCAPASVP